MPQKNRRYNLKSRESKQITQQTAERFHVDAENVFGSKASVEVVEAEFGDVLLVNGKPLLFRAEDKTVFPTLLAQEIVERLPKAVVDMGAVRFVCNGADVMAPGIVRYEGSFGEGDAVAVVDEKHGKPLALGEALYDSQEVQTIKKGAVIKSRHYVSDKVWNFAKAITE
ncbi:MAG: RNA-binding protein [Candidatus Bathyarchaeota archaeon]|nr:RNA-binding protein [Candidatus Bathyarchaeota archaeon]